MHVALLAVKAQTWPEGRQWRSRDNQEQLSSFWTEEEQSLGRRYPLSYLTGAAALAGCPGQNAGNASIYLAGVASGWRGFGSPANGDPITGVCLLPIQLSGGQKRGRVNVINIIFNVTPNISFRSKTGSRCWSHFTVWTYIATTKCCKEVHN